jgi:hypothetical protein
MILNAWHDLFTEKKLAWGYDLDAPAHRSFTFDRRDPSQASDRKTPGST